MIKKWINRFIYKPDSTEIYWGKIIPSIVVIFGFSVIVYFNNGRLAKLKKERDQFQRFTIGITTAEHNNIKGSMVVDYEYIFARSKYTNSSSTQKWLFGKPKTHGGRYFVQLAYNNPSNADILFDYPVPDSITSCPDSGWAYLPSFEVH